MEKGDWAGIHSSLTMNISRLVTVTLRVENNHPFWAKCKTVCSIHAAIKMNSISTGNLCLTLTQGGTIFISLVLSGKNSN